jgi:hypothetical protein
LAVVQQEPCSWPDLRFVAVPSEGVAIISDFITYRVIFLFAVIAQAGSTEIERLDSRPELPTAPTKAFLLAVRWTKPGIGVFVVNRAFVARQVTWYDMPLGTAPMPALPLFDFKMHLEDSPV